MIRIEEPEFWLLLSIFVGDLSRKPDSVGVLEEWVLPLLDRLDFLSKCKDLRALRSILDSLRFAGFQLPWSIRKSLGTELIGRALTSNSISKAKEWLDYAKRTLNCNFYALKEAIETAKSKVEKDDDQDSSLEFMLCVIEEEVCFHIFDESHLLQYVLEEEPGSGHGRGAENSRIAGFLRRGLQSQKAEVRLQALKLAVACSFHSCSTFFRLLPIFDTFLYLEDFPSREYALSALMDLIYMHHQSLKLNAVVHLIVPFLYAPTAKLQLVAVIGCGRFLLFDCFPDELEGLLGAMFERYVYTPPEQKPVKENLHQVAQAMHIFFQQYSGGKKLHQDEIANTLVYMCLEKIEEGLILIGKDATNPIQDNLERHGEVKNLHLALRFGLSISENILEAVAGSLVLNINEELGVPLLNQSTCLTWLLSS